MQRTLIGKRAIVTGGGTGVGRGIARRLLQQGAHVTLAARRAEVLEETAERLRGEIDGASVATVQCDVTKEDEVAAAVARAAGDDGRLDIAVANAGSGAPGPILLLGSEPWRFATDLNILGTALTIKHAGLAMKECGGSIVTISSVDGHDVAHFMAPYTVTKAAVEALTRCAALELAPFRIRVNCIRPGFVPTEGTDLAFTEEEAAGLVDKTPLGRPGDAEEVGDAVLYFSAESGAWVTGQVLSVCGGMGIPKGVSFERLCRQLYGDEAIEACMRPPATRKN